jgi:hypothetical protein
VRVHPEGIHPEGHPEPTWIQGLDEMLALIEKNIK